jgi:hypothetical protein
LSEKGRHTGAGQGNEGGDSMTTEGETGMTDYQFRVFIRMILEIARRASDTKEIIGALEKLLPENEREPKE